MNVKTNIVFVLNFSRHLIIFISAGFAVIISVAEPEP